MCVTITDDYEFKKFKTQIKKVKDKIYMRKLNTKKLESQKEKIGDLEDDIKKILDQERVERELRLAEMEVKKAQNMIDYREQIYSRPKRDWFISNDMKKKINDEAKEALSKEDMAIEEGFKSKKKLKRKF